MHPSQLKFLPNFPPKTHVGYEQGRQQARPIVGSINNIQKTTLPKSE